MGFSYKFSYQIHCDFWDCYKFMISGSINREGEEDIEGLVWDSIKRIESSKDLFQRELSRLINVQRMEDLSMSSLHSRVFEDISQEQKIITLSEQRDVLEGATFEDMLEIRSFLTKERGFVTFLRQ